MGCFLLCAITIQMTKKHSSLHHYRCRTITHTLCNEQYLVLQNLGRSYIFNNFRNCFNIIGTLPNCFMFVPDQWHFFKIQFHLRTFCWFFRLFWKTISPLDFLLVFPPFWKYNFPFALFVGFSAFFEKQSHLRTFCWFFRLFGPPTASELRLILHLMK